MELNYNLWKWIIIYGIELGFMELNYNLWKWIRIYGTEIEDSDYHTNGSHCFQFYFHENWEYFNL